YNMWWGWHTEAASRSPSVDSDKSETLAHTPVKLLGPTEQTPLDELLHDDGFLPHMDRVEEASALYMTAPTWFQETYGPAASAKTNGDGSPAAAATDFSIAYFSAEFGIHESVPVYSGGLGVLSGDHLKSASDLGLP